MKHIVYISPDSELIEHIDALAHEAATKDQAEMLRAISRDEHVKVFKETKDFVLAFNNETISDQGYLLLLDDGLIGKNYILAMLKRKVRELQVNNSTKGDPETIEVPIENTGILPRFPVYAVVRAAGDGDWYEDKVQRITLRRNNVLTLTLADGNTVDASNLYLEHLKTLYDVLDGVDPRDNAILQALSEINDCGHFMH